MRKGRFVKMLLDIMPGLLSTKILTGRLRPECRLLNLILTEKVPFRVPSFEKMVPLLKLLEEMHRYGPFLFFRTEPLFGRSML